MPNKTSPSKNIALVTALLLLIAASRLYRIGEFDLDNDEIWAIWQTFGSVRDIVQWASPTENPLYFLLLRVWTSAVGIHPIVIRVFSLFAYLIGMASLYRAVRRLYHTRAALFAILAFSAIVLNVYLSIYARAYMLSIMGIPIAFWLTLRYFHHSTWQRAIPVALAFLLTYIGTSTAAPAILMIGVFSLFRYHAAVWKWWKPALIIVPIVLADIISLKLPSVLLHTGTSYLETTFAPPEIIWTFLRGFTAPSNTIIFVFWIAITLILIVMTLIDHKTGLFWLAWSVGLLLVLYLLEPRLAFLDWVRYAWGFGFGFAIWLGVAAIKLPHVAQWVLASIWTVMAFLPFPTNTYGFIITPVTTNLDWLAENIQNNDVLVLDPNIDCDLWEEWDYYTQVFFPNGLPRVNEPSNYRRVWYAFDATNPNPKLMNQIETDRIARKFVGPTKCFIRLYEGAPQPGLAVFNNGMTLLGVDVMRDGQIIMQPLAAREGEEIHLRIWWQVDEQIELDYSTALYMLQQPEGTLIAQTDSAPQLTFPLEATSATSQWQQDKLYIEERIIQIPYGIPQRTTMQINLGVYWFGDNILVESAQAEENNLIPLTRITVVAW